MLLFQGYHQVLPFFTIETMRNPAVSPVPVGECPMHMHIKASSLLEDKEKRPQASSCPAKYATIPLLKDHGMGRERGFLPTEVWLFPVRLFHAGIVYAMNMYDCLNLGCRGMGKVKPWVWLMAAKPDIA